MGMFNSISTWLRNKASAVSGVVMGQFSPGSPVYTPDDYEAMAKEGYQKSVYVFRSVNLVAQSCAGIPMMLYRVKGGSRSGKSINAQLGRRKGVQRAAEIKRLVKAGEIEELTEHPLLTLLKRPNPRQGGGQFTQSVMAYRMTAGNTYIEKMAPDTGNNKGVPKELYALRPDRVNVLAGTASDPVRGYRYQAGGLIETLAPENVLHWKTFNPLDDVYGMPPLVAAARSVDQNNVAKDHNVALLQNGARPSGFLSHEGNLGDQQQKNLLTQLRDGLIGSRNAGKMLVLEKGMTWQETGMNLKDMDWIEGQKLSADEIVTVFGVSMVLLRPTDAAFANMSVAWRVFYEATILPLMDEYVDELNRWLVPSFAGKGGDLILAYDIDGIEALRENQDAVYTRTTSAFSVGILSLNDARNAIGWEDDGEYGHLYGWQIEAYQRFGYIPDLKAAPKVEKAKPAMQQKAGALTADPEPLREPWYVAATKQIVKRFKAEQKAVLAAVAGSKDAVTAIAKTLIAQDAEWLKTAEAVYLAVGESFADEMMSSLTKAAGRHQTKDSRTDAQVYADIRTQMQATLVIKLASIRDTTAKRLAAAIEAEAIADGETATAAALRAVDSTYAGFVGEGLEEGIASRAESIAADWVVNASGIGGNAGATATGLPLIDKWRSTGDHLVRKSHIAANGQERKHGKPFDVGGDQLLFPGDTSLGAKPKNTSGCRCYVEMSLDDEAL